MDHKDEKVYTDVPIPERRKRTERSEAAGFSASGAGVSGNSRASAVGISGINDTSAGNISMKSGASAGASPAGKSPWNYITEEDLLRTFGRNYTDSYRERRQREQEQYQAWKMKVKAGETPDDSYAMRVRYARKWACELLGPDRQESSEEGWNILQRFGEMLPDGFTLSGYLPETLKEIRKYYVIIADLPRSYVAEVFADEIAQDEKILALIMYQEADPDQLYPAISEYGRYKGERSAFFAGREDEMKTVLKQVYSAWADAYEEKQGHPLSDDLLGESDTRVWYPYRALHMAIPAEERKKNRIFLVDPVLVYWCRRGSWTITQYFPGIYGSKSLRTQLGQLCRETERLMREAAGFHKLKPADMDEELRKLTGKVVGKYLAEKERAAREAARPKIHIDLSRLGAIRSDADYTRDQLLTGTEEDLDIPAGFANLPQAAEPAHLQELQGMQNQDLPQAAEPMHLQELQGMQNQGLPQAAEPMPAAAPEEATVPEQTASKRTAPEGCMPERSAGAAENPYGLSADESEILHLLLAGESPAAYIRSHHLFASIIADSINEKLFDEIGDSVVEESDGALSLAEDYEDDLRNLL